MNLRLKISQKEGTKASNVINSMQICKLDYRTQIEIKEGYIDIYGITEGNLEKAIENIECTFNIECINIDSRIDHSKMEIPDNSIKPDGVVKKVFFEKDVEKTVNNLLKTMSWAMKYRNASSEKISKFIRSTITEISMMYGAPEILDIAVGDVVSCNYGNHLWHETSGERVSSVVCDIKDDGTFYALPITKEKINKTSKKYLPIIDKSDVDYISRTESKGTIILDKGRYLRRERVNEILGKVRPEFFSTIIEELNEANKFSDSNYGKNLKIK